MNVKRDSSSRQRTLPAIDPSDSRGRNAVLALLIGVVTLAFYLPTLRNEFLDWDDQETVAVNPDFNPPTPENWGHYWTHSFLELYMPLTYTFWGMVALMSVGPEGGSVAALPYHLA